MGALEGIKVLELAGMGPGPFCGMLLADMGAEVVIVERAGQPVTDHRFEVFNRNKRSIRLNLKMKAGADTYLKLVESAHMVIDPYRPGVTARLGIGPDTCLARNSRLVYGQITGWGQGGPLANSPGRDLNYIALTGALDSIGTRETPVIPLNLIGDYGGGALYLLSGLLSAHIHALKTGEGQVVDASICESVASLMTGVYAYWQEGRWKPERSSNFIDGGAPYYNVYECKDRKFISVTPIEDKYFRELLSLIGLKEIDIPDQHKSGAADELYGKLAAVFLTKTQQQWCDLLENTDACFAPVLSIEDAPSHPQMEARGVFFELDGVLQPSPAPRFGKTPSLVRRGPPQAGADTDTCLRDWGLASDEILMLHASGVTDAGVK